LIVDVREEGEGSERERRYRDTQRKRGGRILGALA
jgi:hypothetical protein